jgi:hypothetical protein
VIQVRTTRIPEAIALEVVRLFDLDIKQAKKNHAEKQARESAAPNDAVGEIEQEIEHDTRRARRMLARYNEQPSRRRAIKVAAVVLRANLGRLISFYHVHKRGWILGKRSAQEEVSAEVFPFAVPGLF